MTATTAPTTISIGRRIRAEVISQGISLAEFARRINVARSNVYDIFDRTSIDCLLLQRISVALHHNFFEQLAAETASSIR